MKGYKLIKEYPGSPELGIEIYPSQSNFYSIHPERYPDLWEKFETGDCILSEEGNYIKPGERVYYIYRKSVISGINNSYFVNHSNSKLFSTDCKALEYLNSQIEIQIENEIIKGEDITLYGTCDGNGGGILTTSSYEMWKRNTPYSEKWHWFRTEEERDSYRELHEYKYSKLDLFQLTKYLYPELNEESIQYHVNGFLNEYK